jgi:hypothetical protein
LRQRGTIIVAAFVHDDLLLHRDIAGGIRLVARLAGGVGVPGIDGVQKLHGGVRLLGGLLLDLLADLVAPLGHGRPSGDRELDEDRVHQAIGVLGHVVRADGGDLQSQAGELAGDIRIALLHEHGPGAKGHQVIVHLVDGGGEGRLAQGFVQARRAVFQPVAHGLLLVELIVAHDEADPRLGRRRHRAVQAGDEFVLGVDGGLVGLDVVGDLLPERFVGRALRPEILVPLEQLGDASHAACSPTTRRSRSAAARSRRRL